MQAGEVRIVVFEQGNRRHSVVMLPPSVVGDALDEADKRNRRIGWICGDASAGRWTFLVNWVGCFGLRARLSPNSERMSGYHGGYVSAALHRFGLTKPRPDPLPTTCRWSGLTGTKPTSTSPVTCSCQKSNSPDIT